MNKKDIPFFAFELNKLFHNAGYELEFNNNFQLLIAIILSAQTTNKQVDKATQQLFKVLKTPSDGINLGVTEIKEHIKSLGFFNNKANNIFKTCNILYKEYNSLIPNTIEELIKLPGVGIKTAKVFLAISENAPYIGIDTHVHRVLNRLGLVKTKSPIETDKAISKGFTKENHAELHNTLVLFGRHYCIARKPKCEICPFTEKCDYFKKI